MLNNIHSLTSHQPVHPSISPPAAHTSHALAPPTGDLSHLLNHEADTNSEDFGPAPGSPYILSLVEVFKAITSIFIPAASITSSQTISLRPTDTKPCNHHSSADVQASSTASGAEASVAVRSTFMAALLEHTDDLLDAAATAQASTAKAAVDLEAAASREGDYEYADYIDVQPSTETADLTEEQLRVQQDLVDFAMATIEALPEEPCDHEAASSIDDAAGQAEDLQLQRGFIEYAEATLKPQPLEDEYDDVLMPMPGAAGDADKQEQQQSEEDAGVDRDDAMDFDFSSGKPEPLGEYDDYLEGMTEDLREEQQQQLETAEQHGQAEGEQGSYGSYEGDEDDLITSSVWSTLINEAAAIVKEQEQQQDSKAAASAPSTESITAPVMSVPQGDAITMRRQDRGRLAGLHREHEAITRRRSLQGAQSSSSVQDQVLLDIALAPLDKQLQQGSGSSASQAAALEALAQHAVQTFTRLELVDMDLLKTKQQQVQQELKAALQRIKPAGLRDVIRSTMQVRQGQWDDAVQP